MLNKIPEVNKIYQGDTLSVLKSWPDNFVDCVISSPPYFGLRDYGIEGQIGLEKTLDEYLDKMLLVTGELKRVLKPTGTMWWNHGDSYGGSTGTGSEQSNPGKQTAYRSKPTNTRNKMAGGVPKIIGEGQKCLMLQNFRLAQRMVDEQNWILRNVLIWHKPNVMPSSVKDRFTIDFEPVFFFSKSKKYWFEPQYEPYEAPMNRWGGDYFNLRVRDADKGKSNQYKAGEKEKAQYGKLLRDKRNMRPQSLGRNKRTVWKIPTAPYPEAHFATFPPALIETPIKAGCPEFICKKCGKAREAIFEPSEEYKKLLGKGYITKEQELETAKKEGKPGSASRIETYMDNKPTSTTADYRKTGYSDCGCNAGWNKGIVLDPFMGSGTTALVARSLGRNYIGIELSEKYIALANKRLSQQLLPL